MTYNEDADPIWDEQASDDARALYAPTTSPRPLPVMEPIAGFTSKTEGRKRVAEARRLLQRESA